MCIYLYFIHILEVCQREEKSREEKSAAIRGSEGTEPAG